MIYTNLSLLRQHSACARGMRTLKASLPSDQSPEALISLEHIMQSNGLDHALWALRATTTPSSKLAARIAIAMAYEALPIFESQYAEDKRPRRALEVATAYLDGKATRDELNAARAAEAAARAARAAWVGVPSVTLDQIFLDHIRSAE